jgi:hypothetical protein
MQTAPPPHLHWSPVDPSWLVSIGIILLTVLPHQIPRPVASLLRHPLGAVLIAALAAAIAWYSRKPVLAVAIVLLVAAVQIHSTHEGFAVPILVKDRRKDNHESRWLSEEVLNEDPHGIQERTEEGGFLYDEVQSGEERPWFVESTLDEHPQAIQDRPVSTADPHDTPYETGHSIRPVA